MWKRAHIPPVYKNKGDSCDPTNYRPISLTSVVCKIIEKVLFKYLYNFVLDCNLLCKHQSGFQPNDSTVNQLLEIYDTVIKNLDKGNDVRFIFCDVSKAFDKVWHQGLITKLHNYGFNTNMCSWIADYLTDRQQKVVLDGFSTTFASINAGVPNVRSLDHFCFSFTLMILHLVW